MKKILYVPSLNLGVIFWRIEMYAQALLNHQDRCKVMVEYFYDPSEGVPWDKVCVGYSEDSERIQARLHSAFKYFDVIIFQKIQNKEACALLKKLREEFKNVKVIAEIDDSLGDKAPTSDSFGDAHNWAVEHILGSDAVITTTDYLAKSINKIAPKKKVHVAPNCINYNIWEIKTKKVHEVSRETNYPSKLIKFGYVGANAHDEDLRLVANSIRKITEKHKDVWFVVRYGGFMPEFLKGIKNIDFKQISWHTGVYPSKLAELDLDFAIAPLRDTEFNRCKSEIKWLEWATNGVPVIASDVETYNKLDQIVLSENTEEDWDFNLEYVIDKIRKKEPLFKTIDNLQQSSRKKFDIDKECSKLLTFIEEL